MAWLDKRGRTYRVVFQIGGCTFKRTLGTANEREAAGRVAAVERRIAMIERGELPVPVDVDWPSFVLDNGQVRPVIAATPIRMLADAVVEYLGSIPPGSLEQNTLSTLRIHLRHVQRHLGDRFRIEKLGFDDLQRYVDARCREAGVRGKTINPVTIRKELTSFSGLWSWLRRCGHVTGEFPNRGLRYPKTAEKAKFQTWDEIERQIVRGRLSETEQAELWRCQYLMAAEIDQVLNFVEQREPEGWLCPMLLMAAHTGARRSELLRSQIQDFDLAANTVLIREKKRAKGKFTSRTVPMSDRLRNTMTARVEHADCCHTFHVEGTPLTVDDASHVFKSTFAGSKWEKLTGWHVFRHSFISNCASQGVDQRMIDAWSGHQTDEMRRRYTHLIPNAQQSALQSVFG